MKLFVLDLIHVNVRQKPLQYCKVISLQLIKINGKKIKRRMLRVGENLTGMKASKEELAW